MDWPERLLLSAVRRMPAMRREWGAAMVAELACVRRSPDRWRFAIGCARTALGEGMSPLVIRARGVALISLIWAPLWAAMFGVLVQVLELLIGPNNEPSLPFMMWIVGRVGLVSGAIFGALLAFGEKGKPVEQLSLLRTALWGTLSAAVFPVMTGRANQVFWTCTFGVIVAVAMVAMARRAALSRLDHTPSMLRTYALLPVEDIVNPGREKLA